MSDDIKIVVLLCATALSLMWMGAECTKATEIMECTKVGGKITCVNPGGVMR